MRFRLPFMRKITQRRAVRAGKARVLKAKNDFGRHNSLEIGSDLVKQRKRLVEMTGFDEIELEKEDIGLIQDYVKKIREDGGPGAAIMSQDVIRNIESIANQLTDRVTRGADATVNREQVKEICTSYIRLRHSNAMQKAVNVTGGINKRDIV